MPFEIQNAAALVPQKPPFTLVSNLLYVDENMSVCSFTIEDENIFVKNGYYSTAGMVESMAQTAAAGTGYLFKSKNKPVPIGYIGSVQKLEIFDWPPVKSEITMEVTRITDVLQVSLVSACVKYQNAVLATCEMKIFISALS
jgi:predicted hotdog family 3-hydroxylacyl-ACP dehydratase